MATWGPTAISNTNDDTACYWTGAAWVFYQAQGGLSVGYYSSNTRKLGGALCFRNVTIPAGCTITNAYITFQSEGDWATNTVHSTFCGDDTDDASPPTSLSEYQALVGSWAGGSGSGRRTTAEVDWDSIGSWTNNTDYNSPDLKTIIQEIIDRAGWASGNDIQIVWQDHEARGTQTNYACRAAKQYHTSSTACPKLTIEYTLSPTVATIDPPTSITSSGATLEGSVTDDGGSTVDYYGFVWKTGAAGADPGDSDPDGGAGDYPNGWKSSGGATEGVPFEHDVTGLTSLTTYRFRACAHTSEIGWIYGTELTFDTLAATHRVSNADSEGIKIGGNFISSLAKIFVIDEANEVLLGVVHPEDGDLDPGFWQHENYGVSDVYPHIHCFCAHEAKATLAATNITYTAIANVAGKPLYFPGREGNKIRMKQQTGGSLSVSCTDNRATTGFYDVLITFVNDSSTASQVQTLLAADSTAKYVVSSSGGSGKIAVMDWTALSGGEYYTSSAHVFAKPTEIP